MAAVDAAFYSYSYCGTSHAPRTNPVLTKNLGPLIAKADELPVHSRKGLGNQKEKGGGVQGTGVVLTTPLKPALRLLQFGILVCVLLSTYVTEGGRREEENLGPPNNFKNEK